MKIVRATRTRALIFRIASHLALAAIALLVPDVGPNRFWLAALLIGATPPIAIAVNLLTPQLARNWVEALFDLLLIVTVAHLVPHLWVPAMCLGLMVALAPSVSLHPRSHWIYMGFGVILLSGMTLVALVHDVAGWGLATAAVAVTYPAMLYYTYSQMKRMNELRGRDQLIRGMTDLAGSVAHDFNNMLMGIGGHAELARRNLARDHPAQVDIGEVLNGTERASQLSGQLLNFAGRGVDQSAEINLLDELRLILGLLQTVLPPHIEVKVEAPAAPLYVEVNASQLHQVLVNILLNASEAMSDTEGIIEVALQRVETGAHDAPQVEVVVRDRGHGIPAGEKLRVFEPFYTTKDWGHGLGLATVKRVIEQQHGEISIRDRAGGGTEVSLRWPEVKDFKPPPGSESPGPGIIAVQSESDPVQPGARILVVDDDERILLVAKSLLESLGYAVSTAQDADEAVSVFVTEHDQIAAVLLDLKMPGKDGWTCLAELREVCAQTRIVICSGFNPEQQLPDQARHDQHLQFLNKPFRLEQLAEVLS